MGCCGDSGSTPGPIVTTTDTCCAPPPVPTWCVPICPGPPDICPPTPCPNEDPRERCIRFPTARRSSWANTKDFKKPMHEDCWCNGWGLGTDRGCPKKIMPIVKPTRCPYEIRRTYKAQLRYERALREKLYPPPPTNICSYKPVVMDMQAPNCCSPTWNAVAQICAKPAKSSFYKPGPCLRPGCLHIEQPICKYDGVSKAHCYESDQYTTAWRYPRGYPHIG